MPRFSAGLDESAFDPASSVFVSASAGTGKTNLLVRRVLSLLLHGVAPSKILCITFTNAAAAEMGNRVLKELGAWVMADDKALRDMIAPLLKASPDEETIKRARSLFATVLEAPVPIRIETIHGFCQSLLRRFPLEAGISPHFTVMDTRTEGEMLQEARLRLYNSARDGDAALQEAMRALAQGMSEYSFNELLSEIVQYKRKFYALFKRPGGLHGMIDSVWDCLQVARDANLHTLMDTHFNYDADALSQLRHIADILSQGEADTDQQTGQGLIGWLSQVSQKRAAAVASYRQVFFTREGTPRQRLFTRKILTDVGYIEILKSEQERMLRFNEAWKSYELAKHTCHVLHLASALLSIYDALKRQHARMDYDDLILNACSLLEKSGMAPWVLFKLDGGIDHILVDEAQDTSPEQWRIVQALTEEFFAGLGRSDAERSLFIVGDEKQSIFSFQGADVRELGKRQAYFMQRIEAAGKPLRAIGLNRSFRSTPEVLKAVDAVFARPEARAGLMFEEGDLAHIPIRDHPGLVELWPVVESRSGDPISPATRLARTIADTVRGWLDDGICEAGDIMILLRTRAALADRLVRALKRKGVPVAGADRMQLNDNLAVKDLLALGQCLLLPEDDLTLAALLKSPICGLSEEELFTLAWKRGSKPLWERLREQGGEAYTLLADLRAKADFVSPYELYAHVLDTLGMRRRFTGRMGEEYADPIDEFLMQALLYTQNHTPSLQGFLHWMSAGESEIKRDMEQARGAVRIITVHSAKGLQAPIVILPDTVELPKPKERLLWHEDGPLWPRGKDGDNAFSRKLRDDGKEATLAEYRRLLYVALTRAQDRLYICGANSKTPREQSWYHLVRSGLSSIAAPCETPLGEGLRIGSPPTKARARQKPKATAIISEQFASLRKEVPAEPVPSKPLAPSRLTGDEPAAASPVAGKQIHQRGVLIHKLLQHLPGLSEKDRQQAAQNILMSMPQEMRGECLREALAVMTNPQCAILFAPGSLAEVPVAGNVDIRGNVVTVAGQIDRLFVGEKEVWIADFKSHREPPEAPKNTSPIYLRQLGLYRLLLKQIYPGKTVRCTIIWTAAPRIFVLDEALLDEALLSAYI